MRRVLVLRPEPGATVTLERACQRGLDAVAMPLFEIERLDWHPPEPSAFDGLLLTSANAVRHGGEGLQQLRQLPVYAVGDATAAAAREAGFDVAATGNAGVDRLVSSIDADLKLLHLCGEDRMNASAAPQNITAIPVYRAKETNDVDTGLAAGTVALIHSPRAGRRFAELVSDGASIAIAAISPAAAEAAGPGWAAVEIAESPTDEALLATAARLCNISPAQ
jgi:uroporphyrinogen-III synthase